MYVVIVSHSVLLKMRNVSEKKRCRENENGHLTFHTYPLLPPRENRAVYGRMWKKMLRPDSPPMTIKYGACPLHAG
jgi:hypothetical protein